MLFDLQKLFLAGVIATIALTTGHGAQSAEMRPIGKLSCRMDKPDAAIHFGSSRPMACTFKAYKRRRVERYAGHLKQYGIEVGVIGQIRMSWTVMSEHRRWRRGDLAGTYTGVGAGASLGVGGGASFLVGGSGKRLHLRPLSVETRKGVNVAAGYTRLSLKPLRKKRWRRKRR